MTKSFMNLAKIGNNYKTCHEQKIANSSYDTTMTSRNK